jgi:hypothetical protein
MPITYGDAVSKTNHRSPIVAAYDVVARKQPYSDMTI